MILALILFSPLVGFLINGFWYGFIQSNPSAKKASAEVTGGIATAAIVCSFVGAVLVFCDLMSMPEGGREIVMNLGNWIAVGSFSLDWSFRVDELSSLFLLVITGIGTLIHIYSIGYMHHDHTPGKFFSYLNLFCFSMLILVTGASLPILFLGWEGVGLCSYLLIGYWYEDPIKASAGKKAFVVNRVGDLGFLLGMFFIFTMFNTLDFVQIKTAVTSGAFDRSLVTITVLALFVGCMGKSAQIPLYVWLPDAMAGPTPVSALIHAATMVTSGIYLLARMNFLVSLSPAAMMVIAVTGALTAFFAATIALVQTDIKKVLAYSTVSQLGFMFLACGVGAFTAGVFHVITHAFFKALLFLGAGSVIHGMHEEQDIRKMGGLWSKMPETRLAFMMGWLAIIGAPLFSGFFSKDEILWQAFHSEHGSIFLWALAVITALMTTFYMTRLMVLTFRGRPRFDEKHVHVHESPKVMLIPLYVLAILSLFGGFIGIPQADMNFLDHWLSPVIPAHHSSEAGLMITLMVLTTAAVGAVAYWTWRSYDKNSEVFKPLAQKWNTLYRALMDKWYVDEIYESTIVKPIYELANGAWRWFDVGVVDRIIVGFGRASDFTGQSLRVLQTGSIQSYAVVLVFGVLITLGYLIYGLA